VDIDIKGSDFAMPENVMTAVIDGAEIAVALDDLVDKEAEIERLTKEKSKLESEVERVEKKLANKGFTDKAPQKLVDEERAKGEKYKEMSGTAFSLALVISLFGNTIMNLIIGQVGTQFLPYFQILCAVMIIILFAIGNKKV
jgi:uncharacterized protein (UPF0335 family)